MTTRLDRLFVLLDTGSTPIVRRSAAEQLGQVQKLHPHELHNLLNKLHFYLGSASWESRIAASLAVEAICKQVPQWEPQGLADTDLTESSSTLSMAQTRLQLAQFDILKVLANGAALMASEGTEYSTDHAGVLDAEQLGKQKQLLNKRLGLDVAVDLGTGELFAEEDLMTTNDNQVERSVKLVHHLVEKHLSHNLSARERNRAKRKAKMMSRQTSSDPEIYKNNGDSSDIATNKLRKTASVVVDQADTDRVLVDSVPDNTLNMDQLEEWPFETFCEQLMADLFHPAWEKRHGAATALREIVKLHGKGAGKAADLPVSQMATANQLWLQDAALRLICVMALDRFGDFVSDEVIAPVRETSAQTLGTLLKFMDTNGVESVVKVLLQLLGQQQWEVRHGSLLGFKYLLAVKQDLSSHLLPAVVPHLLPSLTDTDDDVRAVAASALLPVTDQLVTVLPQVVHNLVMCLWHTLLDLDDLTASTGSVMKLLSSLLANQGLPQHCVNVNELTALVPRLYPFLSHNISLVREAALDTMVTLLCRYNIQGNNNWIPAILPTSLRHIFQRALVEEKEDLLDKICQVWQCFLMNIPPLHIIAATSQWTGVWLSLMMQPSRLPLDNNLLLTASFSAREMTPSRTRHLALHGPREHKEQQHYIGGNTSLSEGAEKRDTKVVMARLTTARLLGHLLASVSVSDPSIPQSVEPPQVALGKLLLYHLGTKSALQRSAVAMVVEKWVQNQEHCECPDFVKTRLTECLSEPIYYDEIAMAFTRMQGECRDFITGLKQQGIELDLQISPGNVFTLEQALALSTSVFDSVKVKLKGKAVQLCEDRRRCLQQTVEQTTLEQQVLSNRVQSALASAVVALKCLPDKLNPVIRPLMEAAKKEGNAQLQSCAACGLSKLLQFCRGRDPCPNAKVIKNLCTVLCSDPLFTPVVAPPPGFKGLDEMAVDSGCKEIKTTKQEGILTLCSQIVMCHHGNTSSGRGRKPNSQKWAVPKSLDVHIDTHIEESDPERKQILIGRRGATLCLSQVVGDFGENLEQGLPSLWQTITGFRSTAENDTEAQELVNALQVLEATAPALHPNLHTKFVDLLSQLFKCLLNPYTAIRHMASRCLATLAKLVTMETMEFILEKVVPLLGVSDCDIKRQGAMETLSNVIEALSLDVLPFIVLLIVPVLGRMSDQDHSVRLMATHCFATLIKLLPLESTIPDPPSMKASLSERKEKERKFLEQLLDGSKVEQYKVPIPIKADLRKYQQDGVNWMAFLNKYKLHGILCDDMGLGKTLQALCILAGDMHVRAQNYKDTKAPDCAPLPSIVICPPTLTGHWVYEVEKFIDKMDLNPLHYTGPPGERQRLQKRLKKHNLVVTSYEMVRNDVEFFSRHRWNYCILDEGHIIKNSKTKISRSVKQLNSNHRLILSGTPIQNNVLELWSLFDFLMPGFLGTEKQFQARYGRPILLSRDAKSSSREQEAGALAMEALHRQVLPFLLRRLKEDVLKDLPPKIIQDYYCDLSPLQVQLYEDFSKSRANQNVNETVHGFEEENVKVNAGNTSHVFQALQYLRKVCNHPALALTPSHPQYDVISSQLKQQNSSLRDLQHAPKLTALRQLLQDCGIGVVAGDDTPVVNQHRVLLFCQLKSMLDIVENDLLKNEMKGVTYLRLDGSVPAGSRIGIVNRFNNDPSIDVLLLTTHVGGLGLNLTGADTVVFVEHDWNPMKDLQAMDRAHRIGQKKVVNVYRLITRGTLEEKIMGLQKFKMNIANTVISQDNSSLTSMATDQLLDLFSLDETQKSKSAAHKGSPEKEDSSKKHGVKSVLENLEELWDTKQYESEYNLDGFMKSLSKS